MLKQRIITAIVLALVFLTSLFVEPIWPWIALMTVMVLLGFKEWLALAQVKDLKAKIAGFLLLVGLSAFLYSGELELKVLMFVSAFLWILLIIYTFFNKPVFFSIPLVQMLVGVFVLATTGVVLIHLKSIGNGVVWILLCFGTVWCADIGAYFAGRKFGKTKLAPTISPGKTIEGVIGGLVLVSLVSVPFLVFYLSMPFTLALALWLVIQVVALVSVAGDLFESKLKRAAGLKDSSNILPGHGGILDRLDSLFPALAFLFVGLVLIGLV